MKNYTLSEIAQRIGAELILKDKDHEIRGLAPIETAEGEHISFLANAKYQKFLATTRAAAVLISKDLVAHCPVAALVVADPYVAFAKVGRLFDDTPKVLPGIDPSAIIDPNVQIPEAASIGPFVVIKKGVKLGARVVIGAHCVIGEDCDIGADTELKPRVTLYHKVRLGRCCIIHSGAVLGSDGFGLANEGGKWLKVPQLGGVTLGDDVEIGANTTIDRGAITDTIIANNVKIDNQVQIAHNVIVGEGTAMAAQVGIAGSAEIGRFCLLGGKVGVNGHIKIADQVLVAAMSGVSHNITQKGMYSAWIPARPVREWNKTVARLNRLEGLTQKIKKLLAHEKE